MYACINKKEKSTKINPNVAKKEFSRDHVVTWYVTHVAAGT